MKKKWLVFSFLVMLFLFPKAAAAAMPADDFIDVSSWNGNISVTDYTNLSKHGVKGTVVKLTESTSYFNPYASIQIDNGRKAGLQVSAYHYSQYANEEQARAEARYFATKAKEMGFKSTDLLVNDLEEIRLPNKTANTQAFFDELRKQGFTNLMLYVSGSWLDNQVSVSAFGKENFWVASYPYFPDGKSWYTDYGAWQWSSERKFDGVYSAIGRFDINVDYTGRFTKNSKPVESKPQQPSKPTQPSKPNENTSYKLTKENASFTPTVVNNIRDKPSTSGKVVGAYDPYETVYYDGYIVADGYVWIHYKSFSNQDRYMAVRESGKEAWGYFNESKNKPTKTYYVRSGDTLSGIASQLNTTVSSLLQKNNIANVNLIYAGQSINY